MTEVDNELFQLIEAVNHSKTYIDYDRARIVLKSDPELMDRVNKYREENFKLQNSVDDGTLHDRLYAVTDDLPGRDSQCIAKFLLRHVVRIHALPEIRVLVQHRHDASTQVKAIAIRYV